MRLWSDHYYRLAIMYELSWGISKQANNLNIKESILFNKMPKIIKNLENYSYAKNGTLNGPLRENPSFLIPTDYQLFELAYGKKTFTFNPLTLLQD